jgi:nicotinate dehydrogenase subunit B
VVEAEYEWPFQSHASMGPACAVVDARADGATLWTGSQIARDGAARILGLPLDNTASGSWARVPTGATTPATPASTRPCCQRRSAARCASRACAMRAMAGTPKGPASVHRARAALDKDGAVVGYEFESKGFSRIDIDTNESDPAYSLAGQLTGLPLKC